eukprot:1157762-Pelagomonas_calceolata.AAC.7
MQCVRPSQLKVRHWGIQRQLHSNSTLGCLLGPSMSWPLIIELSMPPHQAGLCLTTASLYTQE